MVAAVRPAWRDALDVEAAFPPPAQRRHRLAGARVEADEGAVAQRGHRLLERLGLCLRRGPPRRRWLQKLFSLVLFYLASFPAFNKTFISLSALAYLGFFRCNSLFS